MARRRRRSSSILIDVPEQDRCSTIKRTTTQSVNKNEQERSVKVGCNDEGKDSHHRRQRSKLLKEFRFSPSGQCSTPILTDNWLTIVWPSLLILGAIALCAYTYFCFDHFHYHLTRFYAERIDDHHAQHLLGHKLIRNQSHHEAFKWFRRSADNGHPHSAYNLAVGHLSGYKTDVKKGLVEKIQ